MQRSLSLSTSLRITNPRDLEDEEDEDSRGYSKQGDDLDDVDSEAEIRKRTGDADPNYSPRKVVAEEVASFERTTNAKANGGSLAKSDTSSAENKVMPNATDNGEPELSELEANYIKFRRSILEGNLAEVKDLVEGLDNEASKIDLMNHVSGKDGFSPLMVAVSCDDDKVSTDLIQYLLKNGARKDLTDSKGNTCIHWAALHGQPNVLPLLIECDEDVARPNNAGDSALHLASRTGRVACCEIMLERFGFQDITYRSAQEDAKMAEASMQALFTKKEREEQEGENALEQDGQEEEEDPKAKVLAELNARRQKEKKETLGAIKETTGGDKPPHHLLLRRNNNYQTAYDVAGSEIVLENIKSGTPAMVKAARIKHAEDTRQAVHHLFFRVSPFFKTLILYHPDCFDHIPFGEEGGRDIWEAPERLTAILKGIADEVDPNAVMMSSDFKKASPEMIKRAHAGSYVDFVCNLEREANTKAVPFTPLIQRRVLKIGDKDVKKDEHSDTSFSPGSLRAALSACGSVCHAIDRVIAGLNRNAFCVVRPPGHHAGINGLLETASSCGFCIFNNVMVGALHSLSEFPDKIQRVAIVDVDVHHGNGTEEIVAKFNKEAMEKQRAEGKKPSPPILFFSSHVYDAARSGTTAGYEFYPGSGQFNNPTSNIINAPMQPLWRRRGYRKNIDGRRSWAERFYFDHFGRQEFKRIIKERLAPALRTFSPDLILISAGFDASRRDVGNGRFMGKYCSGFDLQQQDFLWTTAQVTRVAQMCCEGRVVSVLEGGYGRPLSLEAAQSLHIDRSSLARNCVAHITGLVDSHAKINEDEELSDESSDEKQDQDTEEKLTSRRTRARRPPKRFEGQPEGSISTSSRRGRRRTNSSESDEESRSGTKGPKRRKTETPKDPGARKRDQALRYLRRVKTQYAEHPDVYKQFLVIMGQFKQGTIGVTSVIQEVKSLFSGDKQLIEGFNAFLPPGFFVLFTEEDEMIAKQKALQRSLAMSTADAGIDTPTGTSAAPTESNTIATDVNNEVNSRQLESNTELS